MVELDGFWDWRCVVLAGCWKVLCLAVVGMLTGMSAVVSAADATAGGRMVFDFRDVPADVILDAMAQNFGVVILKSGPVPGRITVSSRGQALDEDEAVNLLNGVLNPLGFGTVESTFATPRRRTLLRVMTVAEAKQEAVPVFYGGDPEKIEESDRVITQVIPLRHIDAVRLRTDLETNPFAESEPPRPGNRLVVTDSARKVKRLVAIIQQLDRVPAARQAVVETVQLKYAPVREVADAVNRHFAPAAGGRGADAGERVYADYDPRTNSLVVNGPPELVKAALGMAGAMDLAVEGATRAAATRSDK